MRLTSTLMLLGTACSTLVIASSKIGCYDSVDGFDNYGGSQYFATGPCINICNTAKKALWAATAGSQCYCGDVIPPDESKTRDSKCNLKCPYYPAEDCGGLHSFRVGFSDYVPTAEELASASSSVALTKTKSSTTTSSTSPTSSSETKDTNALLAAATDHTTTSSLGVLSASATSTEDAKKNGSQVAGIAAGVVVGIIALIAIVVGAWLVVRRNRRLRAEEEYRNAVAAKEFTSSIKKPASDYRLEPVMLQKRMSSGSIADNQDYSRRILKVTNPDGN